MTADSPSERHVQPDRNVRDRNGLGRKVAEVARPIMLTLAVALILNTFVVEAVRIPSSSMENTLLVGDFLLVNKLAYGLRTPRHLPLTTSSVPSLDIPFFTRVHRGDIVVFEYPGPRDALQPGEAVNFIKRCVALPGDTLAIRDGIVTVNGVPQPLPYSAKRLLHRKDSEGFPSNRLFPPGSNFTEDNYGPIVVPRHNDIVKLSTGNIGQWRVFIEREGHRVNVEGAAEVRIDGKTTDTYLVERSYYFLLGDNRANSLDSRYWGFVPEENLIGEPMFVYWSWDNDAPVRTLVDKLRTIRWGRIGRVVR